MRWTELASFTAVFRTHEGNRPDVNHQAYSDGESLEHSFGLATVYAAWDPYGKELAQGSAETGLPLVRHPLVRYPGDREGLGLQDQFMVGSELMVAPVVAPGERAEVYLPAVRTSGRGGGTVPRRPVSGCR